MKYNLKTFILCILCSVTLIACNSESKKNEKLLETSETLLEQYPDSALQLLDSIYYPYSLGTEKFNKYQLLRVQAKDKADMEITTDTVIFGLAEYYLAREDWENATNALFYSGRILQNKGLTKQATQMYLDAESYAQKTTNENLKGLICYYMGDMNWNQYLNEEAVQWFRQSEAHFEKANKYKNRMMALHMLGFSYTLVDECDSAFISYNKALSIAESHKDSLNQSIIMQNIGVVYGVLKDVTKAKESYRKALSHTTDPEQQIRVLLNLAECFDGNTGRDSTVYYVNKAVEVLENDKSVDGRLMVYRKLSEMEEGSHNYKKALMLYKEFMTKMDAEYKRQNDKTVLDIQKRYHFEVMKNENSRLTIHRQYLALGVAVLVIIALVSIVTTMIIRRRQRKTKKELEDANEQIYQWNEVSKAYKEEKEKMQKEHKELSAIAETYEQKKVIFKEILFEHFNILTKTALFEGFLREEDRVKNEKIVKKFNELVYNQDKVDWKMILRTMDQLYDNMPTLLKNKFPQLDDSEFKIYCLTYADLNNTEISIVMGLSINTIQARKSGIRRKLGIGGYGNIVDFLREELNLPKY